MLQIYDQINKADIIVADTTDQNANVFYEIGYARALKKRLVLLTQDVNKIPFDLKSYPHIAYDGLVSKLAPLLEKKLRWLTEKAQTPRISSPQFWGTRNMAYKKIAETIKAVDKHHPQESGYLSLSLSSLHSPKETEDNEDDKSPETTAFDNQMYHCINSKKWKVRNIFNVTNTRRLNKIRKLLDKTKNAEGWEVRAYAIPNTLPLLNPLIIGDEDITIAIDDPNRYRIESALYLRAREYVRWAEKYFESLWGSAHFQLRTEHGIQPEEIQKLEVEINKISQEK